YQRRGPRITTRMIVEFLRRTPVRGQTLLDVGGGIGVIGLELQPAGIRDVTMVEASPGFLVVAEEQYGKSRHPTPYQIVEGDFAKLTPAPAADIVTLDRGVGCYPDYRTLLKQAAESARVTLALSFPKNAWLARAVIGAFNLFMRLKRDAFRGFVHPEGEMAAVLAAGGWERRERRTTLVWCVERWGR